MSDGQEMLVPMETNARLRTLVFEIPRPSQSSWIVM